MSNKKWIITKIKTYSTRGLNEWGLEITFDDDAKSYPVPCETLKSYLQKSVVKMSIENIVFIKKCSDIEHVHYDSYFRPS